jgi:alpha-tubulin suppressor-like RCC1 family protein
LHSTAIKSDGTYWAWGPNINGSHGDGTTASKLVPTQIGTNTNWKSVHAGTYFTSGMNQSNVLFSWGRNSSGQLGIANQTDVSVPTQVACATLSEIAFSDSNSISMTPNPVKETININAQETIEQVDISDIFGKVVWQQLGDIQQIDVAQLKQGIYFIQIQSQGKTLTQKFIKE